MISNSGLPPSSIYKERARQLVDLPFYASTLIWSWIGIRRSANHPLRSPLCTWVQQASTSRGRADPVRRGCPFRPQHGPTRCFAGRPRRLPERLASRPRRHAERYCQMCRIFWRPVRLSDHVNCSPQLGTTRCLALVAVRQPAVAAARARRTAVIQFTAFFIRGDDDRVRARFAMRSTRRRLGDTDVPVVHAGCDARFRRLRVSSHISPRSVAGSPRRDDLGIREAVPGRSSSVIDARSLFSSNRRRIARSIFLGSLLM
jgi:hypothetical protein